LIRENKTARSEPGRSCPIHYRYSPGALARSCDIRADTLYIVGGLYGNRAALDEVLAYGAREKYSVRFCFNGDFNWFNVDAQGFEEVNSKVLEHLCLRGNVETEVAAGNAESGCGCAYPEWVDDKVVASSNTIMGRLAETARGFPRLCEKLAKLPMHLVAEVGELRVGIVHGDAESLAGWNFSQEELSQAEKSGLLERCINQANVQIFACTHTGLPVCQDFDFTNGRCAVINNGAAGLPNFRDTRYGLMTRISTMPAPESTSLYGMRLKEVYVDAIPVHFDYRAWQISFLENWPPGSVAYASYFDRLTKGPEFVVENAVRGNCRRY
jgi:predicted phosphodiesterase